MGLKNLCTYPHHLLDNSDEVLALDIETMGHKDDTDWGDDSDLPIYYSWAATDILPGAGTTFTQEGMDFLQAIVKSKRPLVFHNGWKFDVPTLVKHKLMDWGDVPPQRCHDTLIGRHLLDENHVQGNALKALARELLGEDRDDEYRLDAIKARYPKFKCMIGAALYDQQLFHTYAVADARNTLMLWNIVKQELKDQELWDLYLGELEACRVFIFMRLRGVEFDDKEARKVYEEFKPFVQELLEDVWGLFGTEFNPNSYRQLGPLLDEVIQRETGDSLPTSRKSGYSKTDKDTLEPYKHLDHVQRVLCYKKVRRAHNTLLKNIERKEKSPDGRLHPLYQPLTITGRTTCSQVPLQQIPKTAGKLSVLEIELGIGHSPVAEKIATAFQATRKVWLPSPGAVLVSMDYDQGEYRAAAHYGNMTRIIKRILDGEDFHAATGEIIFGKYDDFLRNCIKIVNFGLLYGMGPNLLITRIRPFTKEPEGVLERYENNLPEMRAFQHSVIRQSKLRGYVKDVFGRRYRYRPDKEYAAVSYLCQGTVATMKKIAAVRCHKILRPNWVTAPQAKESYIDMDIHDQLVFSLYPKDAALLFQLREQMQNFPQFKLPTSTDLSIGPNLFEQHKVSTEQAVDFISHFKGDKQEYEKLKIASDK